MAFLDALGLASNGQAVTADAVSTNTIDLGDVTPKRAIGTGEPIGFGIYITAIGTTSGSLIVSAISSAGTDLGTATKMASRPLITAQIAAGASYFIEIPPGQPILRYVGVDYDVTGTVDATITACLMPQSFFASWQAYARGYTIS